MDAFLTFIRDKVVGFPYVILILICLFLIFAIIGYLCSMHYKSGSAGEKL